MDERLLFPLAHWAHKVPIFTASDLFEIELMPADVSRSAIWRLSSAQIGSFGTSSLDRTEEVASVQNGGSSALSALKACNGAS
jgi:hypothetical protein